ncbi:MAG: glycosyltransferase family 4 protein [Candidatus Margulisiibacteriota bacterium]
MKILILSESFPPETKSCSTLFFELSESLVKNGHEVSVITRLPKYNVADGVDLGKIPSRETISGVQVYRYQTPPLARDIPVVRGLEHFLLGLTFFWGGLFLGRFDVILVYSPPLPLGIAGYWLGKIKRCPVVVNIQDLYPQTVIDLGLLKSRLLIKVSQMMERFIYRRSAALTVHSAGNKEYLVNHGAAAQKVRVIYNWVDVDLIKPGDKDNPFARQYGLKDKFVVSFAGVMGFAQGLEVVIRAAERLRDKPDILFIMVGDGTKKPELEKLTAELGLNNVRFIPTQPVALYPQVLHASALSLVVLDKTLVTPVVPGKLLSVMAAGIPVVASLPLVGDAPKIIAENGCGVAVAAGEPAALAEAIVSLYNDERSRRQMGSNGRRAAEKLFSRQACVQAYEELFRDL